MSSARDPEVYLGKTAVDAQGGKIGAIEQVYLNDQSGQLDWVTVKTGMFGKARFAPLNGSCLKGDKLVLPLSKDLVKGSPEVADTAHLDAEESGALYSYYQQYLKQTVDVENVHLATQADQGAVGDHRSCP